MADALQAEHEHILVRAVAAWMVDILQVRAKLQRSVRAEGIIDFGGIFRTVYAILVGDAVVDMRRAQSKADVVFRARIEKTGVDQPRGDLPVGGRCTVVRHHCVQEDFQVGRQILLEVEVGAVAPAMAGRRQARRIERVSVGVVHESSASDVSYHAPNL